MKNLKDFINEGNISNVERKYREFVQMCTGYGCKIEDVTVRKTVRNNWAVYIGDRRRFTASNNILDQEVVDKYNIKTKTA